MRSEHGPEASCATLGEPFFVKYLDHGAQMSMEAAKARIQAETPAATPS